MPTLSEVLRQSGYTEEQIKALDPRVTAAFGNVLTEAEKERKTAQAAREAAELAQRSNVDFYENKIAPSLANWEEEKARVENERAKAMSEAAFYRTQNEEARKGGFITTEAPGFDPSKFTPVAPSGNAQPRDGSGRYVAGTPGGTPGSPSFDVNQIYERAGNAVGLLTDIQWEHQSLFGKPMPISPTELVRQADMVKLDPKTYAARTFNFEARRQQIQEEQEKTRADQLRAEGAAPWEQKVKEAEEKAKKELAELDRKWAERVGSNPDVRIQQETRYGDINRAREKNEIPDPLTLTDQQRRQVTAQMIRKDIESQQPA